MKKKYFHKSIAFRVSIFVLALGAIVFLNIKKPPTALGAVDSTLYFSPSPLSRPVGADFTIDAIVDPGSTNQVNGVELHTTYDQTKLRLDSISVGASFPVALSAASIPGNGTASIAVGTAFGSTVTSPEVVATFHFHALSVATNSSIAFTTGCWVTADNTGGTNDFYYAGSNSASITVTSDDVIAPTGGSVDYVNGNYTSLSIGITANDGSDEGGGSGIDTSSRTLQRHEANLSAGTCASYDIWATIIPAGTYPNYTDTTVVSGKCYQYKYLVSDNAGNTAPYTSVNVVKVDSQTPTGGSVTISDGYYTSLSVGITAVDGTDSVSGLNISSRTVKRRESSLTAGTCASYGSWADVTSSMTGSYPNYSDDTVLSGKCYQYQYLISDNFTNQATYTGSNTAKVDNAGPSGGAISYVNGYYNSVSIGITASDGSDLGGSGIDTSSRVLERQEANLSGGTCASYGSWTDITSHLAGSYPDFIDDYNTQAEKCYKYRYKVSDNAGSETTYTSVNEIRVDADGPSGGSISYLDGFYNSLSVGLTASDGTDSSGIDTSSRSFKRRTATLSGTSCGTYGSWTSVSPTGTYPNYTDNTVTTNNCYQYQYLVSDNSGVQTTYTGINTAKVDNAGPVISAETATSFTDVSATITWTTNEGATSQVEYGESASYGSTSALDSSFVTSHSLNLTGLSANTLYHYRVLSSDGVPYDSIGTDHTLATSLPTAGTPTATPDGGSYSSSQSVTLSTATSGATIYYTTDGTDPTASSSVYSSAISVPASITIKAIAINSGMADSVIMEKIYTISGDISSNDDDSNISSPDIKIGTEAEKLSHRDTNYSRSRDFKVKGSDNVLANGQIDIYRDNKKRSSVTADDEGNWDAKIKTKNDDRYKFKFHYYDSSGNDLGDSSSYEVKIDSKKPKFTDLPLTFYKRHGETVWWKAEDESSEIVYYRYTLDGKTVKTEKGSFIMPSLSWGPHVLTVKATDKAGNVETRRAVILVW